MVLMNVEDYPGAIREAYRVLAPGGAICMSITHPCFSAPVSDWVGGKGRRPRHFAVDRYFERIAWHDRIAPTFRTPTLRRHRPLEDYMTGAIEAGFALREFQEPMATEEELKASARFEPMTRVPYFLFMRWKKTAGSRPPQRPVDGGTVRDRLGTSFVGKRQRVVRDADRHRAAVLERAEQDLVGQRVAHFLLHHARRAAARRTPGRSPSPPARRAPRASA